MYLNYWDMRFELDRMFGEYFKDERRRWNFDKEILAPDDEMEEALGNPYITECI